MRGNWLWAAAALAALAGCGGGGAGGGGEAPTRSKAEARFDVDLKTGKVTVSSADGRAVYQGSAVAFSSSDVLTVNGDSGQRLIHVAATNRSGQTWGGAPVNLTVSDVVRADAAALRAGVRVTNYAGFGTAAESDGYRTGAGVGTILGIGLGDGPLAGALVFCTAPSIRGLGADGMVSTLAGMAGAAGFADGVGSTARFSGAHGVACDGAGNVFVADGLNRRVRRVTPLGEASTIAGTGVSGALNSTGDAATFGVPYGIAVSASGDRVYVSDNLLHMVRMVKYRGAGPREQASSYDVTTVSGALSTAGLVDGPGAAARHSFPSGVALMTDLAGAETLFVVENGACAVRRITAPATAPVVTTIAGSGSVGDTDGAGGVALFRSPKGIAGQWLDSSSYVLFVAESNRIRSISFAANGSPTQKGSYLVSTIAGTVTAGVADGDGNTARFNTPIGLVAVPSGSGATLYVADSTNSLIRKVIVPSGTLHSGGAASTVTEPVRLVNWDREIPNRVAWYRTMAGSGAAWSADLQFYIPEGVTGFSFLATIETDSNMVNLPASGAAVVSTVAGYGVEGATDGLGRTARFAQPSAVVAVPPAMRSLYRSPGGAPIRAFVADSANDRIRYIDTAGYVGLWAGSTNGFADGVGATAKFAYPAAMALHPDGSLIVADTNGQRIRRVWPNQQVTTIAGTGLPGSVDGAGSGASFSHPRGVAVNSGGRIYIADTDNHTIRRILLAGTEPRSADSYKVATIAGVAGAAGFVNSAGTSARFQTPTGMVCDGDGRVLVADQGNNAIRWLDMVDDNYATCGTMVAGISSPVGVALDSARNLYITVLGVTGPRVYRAGLDGGAAVSIAGGSTPGVADGSPGQFSFPIGIAVEASGTLLVTDANSNSIRAVSRIVDTAAP